MSKFDAESKLARAMLDYNNHTLSDAPADHPVWMTRNTASLPSASVLGPSSTLHEAVVGIGIGGVGVWGTVTLNITYSDGGHLFFIAEVWGAIPIGPGTAGGKIWLNYSQAELVGQIAGIQMSMLPNLVQVHLWGKGANNMVIIGNAVAGGATAGVGLTGGAGSFTDPTQPNA